MHALAAFRRELVYDLLFDAAAHTMLELGRQRLGAELGATMVLHTWSRTLLFHPHVHAMVTGGGLSLDGSQWVKTRKADYFMPVKLLGAVFRRHFIEGLCALREQGALELIRFAGHRTEPVGSRSPDHGKDTQEIHRRVQT